MKQLIEYGRDDHPGDDAERAQVAWSIVVLDDCDECGDLRVELVLEPVGSAGAGVVAHLAPDSVRRIRRTLSRALIEIGEQPDD